MTNRAFAVAVAVVSTGAVGLHAGQDPPTPPPTSFEAASVKPNRSGDPDSSVRRQPGGRFNTVNAPLRSLITLAYQLQGFQLVGAPDWVGNERFDIVAKIEGDPPPMPPGSPSDPMILAVRALLAERFKLVVHRETRQLDIYALVVATPDGKPGRALRQTTQDCPALMAAAARGGALSRGPLPAGADAPAVDPDAPSLFTALQEQLGLKLESTKGPVEVLVVDSVDRPTPD